VRVLPVLGLFASSRLLASEMPDAWLMTIDSGTIQQALARNDRESAAALIRRHMERPLRGQHTWPCWIGGFRDGWETAPGGRPAQYGTGALGWLSRVHHLPGPISFQEPRRESARPLRQPVT
jgi:hypothetical protein